MMKELKDSGVKPSKELGQMLKNAGFSIGSPQGAGAPQGPPPGGMPPQGPPPSGGQGDKQAAFPERIQLLRLPIYSNLLCKPFKMVMKIQSIKLLVNSPKIRIQQVSLLTNKHKR